MYMGRLKNVCTNSENEIFYGRLVCDLKKWMQEYLKPPVYNFDALCNATLNRGQSENDSVDLVEVLCTLGVVSMCLEITNLTGSLMRKTLLGGKTHVVEYILMHTFNEKNYIVPEEPWQKESTTYKGGIVLDPNIGLYSSLVLLLDFKSLYPCIIKEFNICFTSAHEEIGVLPTAVSRLVERRFQLKEMMKCVPSAERRRLDAKQKMLKVLANSVYGCLGFSKFRFRSVDLAALVARKGRATLLNAVHVVEGKGFKVIYGDTDSVMVDTGLCDYDAVSTNQFPLVQISVKCVIVFELVKKTVVTTEMLETSSVLKFKSQLN